MRSFKDFQKTALAKGVNDTRKNDLLETDIHSNWWSQKISLVTNINLKGKWIKENWMKILVPDFKITALVLKEQLLGKIAEKGFSFKNDIMIVTWTPKLHRT